jgi:outer membrane immunogenic protein
MRLFLNKVSLAKIVSPMAIIIMSSQAQADEVAGHYNWDGLYFGAFAGGATGSSIYTTEPVRLDNLNYWFRPFNSSYSYRSASSVIAGGTIGYNFHLAKTPIVFGIEAEYGYLNESGSSIDPNQIAYVAIGNSASSNIGKHWTNIGAGYGYGFAGVRAGYAIDSLLIYVKAGSAFSNIKTAYNSIKTEDNISPLPSISTSSSIDNVGFAVGGGVEFAPSILKNISLKAEYLYLGIDNVQPTYGYCSCHFQWTTVDRIGAIHTAKVGINYHFVAGEF